jgi:hypothetical protein
MESTILEDNTLFLSAVILGFFFGLFYECFRFARLAFPHPSFLVAVEDLIFFFPTSLVFIFFHYAMADGIIRWFSFAGACIGFFLYFNTLGKILLFFSEAILNFFRLILRFVFKTLLAPIVIIFKNITNCLFVGIKKIAIIGKTKISLFKIRHRKKRLIEKAKRGF